MIQLYREASPLPPSFPASLCQEVFYREDLSDADRDLFFPDKFGRASQGTRSPQDTARMSKDVCNGTGGHAGRGECPHREECGLWGLLNRERFGVWGGMSERERARLRKRIAQLEEERRSRTSDDRRRLWSARQFYGFLLGRSDLVRHPVWLTAAGGRHSRYAAVAGLYYEVVVYRLPWEVRRIDTAGHVLAVVAKVDDDAYDERRTRVLRVISEDARERAETD